MSRTPDPTPIAVRRLAASDWTLWSTDARLVVTDPGALPAARALADELLARIDAAASRFRGDSELNRLAPRLPEGAAVSPLLAELVRRALEAAAQTDGLVDPTLGRELAMLGYDRDIRLVTAGDRPTRAVIRRRPGWRSVRLVQGVLRVPGTVALDLGATAKAHAADLVAALVAERCGCGVLVSLGGDIATAGEAPAGGWSVRVQDTDDDPAALVAVAGGTAVATSSTTRRRWVSGGVERNHILDPRTGMPVPRVWRSVTVAAPSCLEANTLSTAAVVAGTGAIAFLAARRAAARLVTADGGVLTVGGWPDERLAGVDRRSERPAPSARTEHASAGRAA